MTRAIVSVAASVAAVGTERAAIDATVFVTVKGHAHLLEPEDFFGCVLNEALNHGTLAQPISGGHDVVGKILGRVIFSQWGVDPTLRNCRVGTQRMTLRQ